MVRSQWFGSRMGWLLGAVTLCALLAAIGLAPTRALADGSGNEQGPPVISDVSVTPLQLPSGGGTITLTANVVDGFGTNIHTLAVYSGAYGSDGSSTGGDLFAVDPANPNSFAYRGTVTIPPNTTAAPMTWDLDVYAQGDDGQTVLQGTGPVTVDAPPVSDAAPAVSGITVTPTSVPAAGGDVTIEATATDDRSVAEVDAHVTAQGGAQTTVAMAAIGASRFRGTFHAPANATSAAITYTVQVTALDDIGQQTTQGAPAITVAAKPPPPPAGGPLTVTPATVSFGSVRVGSTGARSVVLRNAGPRRSGPVSGVLSVSGGSFSLPGAGAAGVRFTLAAGQWRVVTVVFRPAKPGSATGGLSVVRSDHGQAGLGAKLTGMGVRR